MSRPRLSGCEVGPYLLTRLLGAGSSGSVYRAVIREKPPNYPKFFAVKCLPKGEITPKRGVQLISEILYHDLTVGCPNVLALRDIIDEDPYLFLVLDLCDTDMRKAINNRVYWRNDARIREAFIEILDAVGACHKKRIFHRDLKPGNIMCNAEGTGIRVGDFGLATHHRISRDGGCGTPSYMSPESWMSDKGEPYHSVPTDIWSLGVILFNMVTNRDPWEAALSSDEEFSAFMMDEDHLFQTSPISERLNLLLKWVMHPIPSKRLPISAIREVILEIDTFYKKHCPSSGRLPLSKQVAYANSAPICSDAGVHLNENERVVVSCIQKH